MFTFILIVIYSEGSREGIAAGEYSSNAAAASIEVE